MRVGAYSQRDVVGVKVEGAPGTGGGEGELVVLE
jgi:hypothetical protein